jgi:hypothetical protein
MGAAVQPDIKPLDLGVLRRLEPLVGPCSSSGGGATDAVEQPVRIWRRLRALGALALKRSAYLLPGTPERYEDFQWLAQEVEREGGEATLVRVQPALAATQDVAMGNIHLDAARGFVVVVLQGDPKERR